MPTPHWENLVQHWPNGHLKLAWTRQLLKIRSELADVFTHGDYQPLEVFGPHRDHVIAFARRHGRDAAIIVVAKSFATMTQGGRVWPRADAFDGALSLKGTSLQSKSSEGGAAEIRLSTLFRNLPAAVLKARFTGAIRPSRKRKHA
jgi:(1->4)-alpha-D-glucan 1-alpha-D-glucosylmutase